MPPDLVTRRGRRGAGALLLAALLGGVSCGPPPAPAGPRPLDLGALVAQAREHAATGDATALRDLGWLELLAGDPTAATADLDRALRQAPADPLALLGAALVRDDDGAYVAAWPLWLRLLRRAAAPAGGPRRSGPGAAGGLGAAELARAAEVAAAALAASVDEVPDTPARQAALAALPVDRLPGAARREVVALLARLSRTRGAEADAAARERSLRCVPRWWVVGPYGTFAHLDLDGSYPPRDPAWGAQPEGTGADRRELREVPGRGCRVLAESQTGRAGVLYALTGLEAAAATEVLVTVESEVDVVAAIDGRDVLRRHDPTRFLPRRLAARVTLPGGRHRLVLRFAAGATQAEARVYLTTPAGGPVPGLRFGDPRGSRPGAPPPGAPAPLTAPPPTAGPPPLGLVARYLAARTAALAGDADTAAVLLAPLLAAAPRFTSGLYLRAAAALTDPSRPAEVNAATARAALQAILATAPRSAGALVELAELDVQDERPRDALKRLDRARALRPERARIDLLRFEVLEGRGWDREAELALDAAEGKHPDSYRILEARGSVLRKRHDAAGLALLGRKVRAINAESDAPAQVLREADDLAGAIAEYRRLLALDPQGEQLRSDLAEVLLQAGDAAGAAAELRRLVREQPRRPGYRVRLADALLAGGDPTGARRVLEDGVAFSPEASSLRRALEALGLPGLLDRWRLDGRAVIADFERGGHRYADPAVEVLDRTVSRIFPGGARLTLTHNITKVLTKEGAERNGEVRVPENADVLTLRTVKRDGTTREPEAIAGKRTVSVPDLEVGDYVEVEYVQPEEPLPALAGGFLGERFYFRSFDVPLDRTEFVVVMPREMTPIIDARADPPPLEERVADGLVVRQWRRRRVPQAVVEPLSPPAVELLPSVRVGVGVTHARLRDLVREQLWGLTRANAELRAVARDLCRGEANARRCARAVHQFVVKQIEPRGEGGATQALARRQGNRLMLTSALLREAGLAVELWLVKSRTQAADPRPGHPTPLEDGAFADAVLRVAADGGAVFLDPRARRAPFGYLAPALRGGMALRLAGSGPLFAVVPRAGVGEDRRDVSLQITLAADGTARVRARELLVGAGAQEWRDSLDHIPQDQLRKEFEQRWLGYFFAGATLQRLAFTGQEDPSRALELEYEFTARLGRRTGARLTVPLSFFALELSRRYVGVAQRRFPLMVLAHPTTQVHVELRLPAGARATVPAPALVEAPFGRLSWRATAAPGVLRLERRSVVPLARVAPARYPAFVAFAAAVDQADGREAVIDLP